MSCCMKIEETTTARPTLRLVTEQAKAKITAQVNAMKPTETAVKAFLELMLVATAILTLAFI